MATVVRRCIDEKYNQGIVRQDKIERIADGMRERILIQIADSGM